MHSSNQLERRLREDRYRRSAELSAAVLTGLMYSKSDFRLMPLDELDAIWPKFLARLREEAANRKLWAAERVEDLQRELEVLRLATGKERVLWFAMNGPETVGYEVLAGGLLSAALAYLVNPAADLFLATHDLSSGLCLELNHLPTGDEYELVTWGIFDA